MVAKLTDIGITQLKGGKAGGRSQEPGKGVLKKKLPPR